MPATVRIPKKRILLDLDNTALLYDSKGNYRIHSKLVTDLLPNYTVILYSAREDVESFAKLWDVDFIWKSEDRIPEADFLIGDQCEFAGELVCVKKKDKSINCGARK